MSVQIHTIKGNQYAYKHFRDGAKVRSVYLYPVNEGGKKRSSMHGGGAPVKSAAVDAKRLNSNRDNHSIGQQPKEIKNTMSEIDKLKQDVTDAGLAADDATTKRTQYVQEFRGAGKTGMYTDNEYIRLDEQQQDARTARFDAEQKLQYAINDAKVKKPKTLDKHFDYKHQFGNDSLNIRSRADYETTSAKLGVKTETDKQISTDYGLRFAEHTDVNWKNMTRAERVRQVVGAQYQKALDEQAAEIRRKDPERQKMDDEQRKRQIAADKFHHDLDNDVY